MERSEGEKQSKERKEAKVESKEAEKRLSISVNQ